MTLNRDEQIAAMIRERPDDFRPTFAFLLPVAIETVEVKFERGDDGRWCATSADVPGLLVEADTVFEAEAAVPAAVRAARAAPADEKPRFTVEPITTYSGDGIGEFAIRYTPASRKNADGSTTFGLSFHALLAGDALGNQEATLREVAAVLNASHIGRPE